MAGGWNKQGSGVPLAERVRTDVAPATPSVQSSTPPLGAECPSRHCWVSDAVDGAGVRRPGLLVRWQPTDAGWQGLVVYAVSLRPGEWQLVQEWLPAALLTPL